MVQIGALATTDTDIRWWWVLNSGCTLAVAGYLEISTEILAKVRNAGHLPGPVLWAPVLLVAA